MTNSLPKSARPSSDGSKRTCSRRKVTKTESQMGNYLEGQTLDRFITVRAKMAHGATDEDVHEMVLAHVGKSNAALDHALHLHHRTANLQIEKALEIERAVGRVVRENSARTDAHMTALTRQMWDTDEVGLVPTQFLSLHDTQITTSGWH